ncbi:DUF1036 domain-containing protein [Anabaena subtropica]|uniref:DUF1036 domain-containing protein n=1 Tax=Anabaena subtropica FACHB-260 TaxID=2692884 RepID=A0ABR8CIW0_9NOST|nr:DUF1036 domain-containing protein [Anabaena subtropica]MBD2343142.1 DUF1036 domain-containing protein [Anabaena subtropica FACHB-260]
MKAVSSLIISSLLSLPIVLSIAPAAKADLIVCSNSKDKAYVAKAWYSGGRWVASGWTHIYSGQCEVVLVGDMRKASTYIYVANKNWEPWRLQGRKTSIFCLQQSSFQITNADKRCSSRMIPKAFYQVTSPGNYDHTIRLR